jgi:hypothetical protein
MKKKYIFIISLIIISSLFVAFFIFRKTRSSSNNPPNSIVGGDRDEHGCINSAGYSWCEAKGKCLRTWEESCSKSNSCGIENCHGMDIVCGPKPAEICTEIYQLGDKCRQYAKCSIKEGKCQKEENLQFTNCKSCVENCLERYKKDQVKMFECESQCS